MHCGEVVKAERHINQDPMSGDVGAVARIVMADGSVWWVRVGRDGQPIIERRGELSRSTLEAELSAGR